MPQMIPRATKSAHPRFDMGGEVTSILEPRLPLMADRTHDDALERGVVLVERDVAGSPARDHQLAQLSRYAPPDQRMRCEHVDRLLDQVEGGFGRCGIAGYQEIGDVLEVLEGAMVPEEPHHVRLPLGGGNADQLRPAGLLALGARTGVAHRLLVRIRDAGPLELRCGSVA